MRRRHADCVPSCASSGLFVSGLLKFVCTPAQQAVVLLPEGTILWNFPFSVFKVFSTHVQVATASIEARLVKARNLFISCCILSRFGRVADAHVDRKLFPDQDLVW